MKGYDASPQGEEGVYDTEHGLNAPSPYDTQHGLEDLYDTKQGLERTDDTNK